MSAQEQIDEFAKGMADLQKDWPNLKPDARQKRMQTLVDERAKKGGFPPPEVKMADLGQRNGELRFKTWDVAVNSSLVQSNSLSPQQAAQLGDTLYHETRHAEQWYLIARRQAAEGQSDKQIRDTLGIPDKQTKHASKEPLLANDPRRACADALHKSVYGADRNARNKTLQNLSQQGKDTAAAQKGYKEAKAAEDALREQLALEQQAYASLRQRQPPPTKSELEVVAARYWKTDRELKAAQATTATRSKEWKTAYDAYQKTYANYRALPEEADAWDSGGRAAAAVQKALTKPVVVRALP